MNRPGSTSSVRQLVDTILLVEQRSSIDLGLGFSSSPTLPNPLPGSNESDGSSAHFHPISLSFAWRAGHNGRRWKTRVFRKLHLHHFHI
ncbi:hypothetical protein DsansV1_C03g0031381 [Dioscorea sansibarensis]